MLNLQKTIIFCVLFAAVWLRSTKAVTDEQESEINYLKTALIDAKYSNCIPNGGINHFNSWRYWPDVPDIEKLKIVDRYKEKLNEENLRLDSRTDKKRLTELAYKALNDYVLWRLEILEKNYDRWVVKALTDVARQGHFLDYMAYKGDAEDYVKERTKRGVRCCGLICTLA